MAETFKVGANARELLRYTQRATRIVTDDISRSDARKIIQKLRRDSSKRMKNKIKYWETAYPAGEVTKQEILRSFDAWDAHAAHGDTYSLRRKYADRLEKLLDCKIPIHRKINSNKLARDRRRARQCRCIYKKQHKALSLSVSQNTRPAEIMPWA
jgi:hypothetical protein